MSFHLLWDLDDDPQGNVRHIGEHGLDRDDVQAILDTADRFRVSRSSGEMIAFGYAFDGRRAAVVYHEVDGETAYPITAFYLE